MDEHFFSVISVISINCILPYTLTIPCSSRFYTILLQESVVIFLNSVKHILNGFVGLQWINLLILLPYQSIYSFHFACNLFPAVKNCVMHLSWRRHTNWFGASISVHYIIASNYSDLISCQM